MSISEILTIESITNHYLYGSYYTPSNLATDALIRPLGPAFATPVVADVDQFMNTGAGRFALGAKFELIQKFFDLSNVIPNGIYSKSFMAEQIFNMTSYGLNIKQVGLADGYDDYVERTYIWNETAFMLGDVQFVVDENGRRIENFSVMPNGNENFDFEGSNPIINAYQSTFLKPNIDPSNIGRQVIIEWSDSSLSPYTYTKQNFDAESSVMESWTYPSISDLFRLNNVPSALFDSGVTTFQQDGRVVYWGTVEGDQKNASDLDGHQFLGEPALSGLSVYLGDGSDEFIIDRGSQGALFAVDGSVGFDQIKLQVGYENYWTVEISDIEYLLGSDYDDSVSIISADSLVAIETLGGSDIIDASQESGLNLAVNAGDGDDRILLSNLGSGFVDGGEGVDVISFEAFTSSVNLQISNGAFGSSGYVVSNVEAVLGTRYGDIIVASGVNVFGGEGNDLLMISGVDLVANGDDGNDNIYLEEGSIAYGGEGHDQLFINGKIDPYFGYQDFELVTASSSDDNVHYDAQRGPSVFLFDGNDIMTIDEQSFASQDPGQLYGGYFSGGGGSDTLVFDFSVSNGSGWMQPSLFTVDGFETLVDGVTTQPISWVTSTGDYSVEYLGDIEKHIWVVPAGGQSYEMWRLEVRLDVPGPDGARPASISYQYTSDVRLEADSPGYGTTVNVTAFASGDFGIPLPSGDDAQRQSASTGDYYSEYEIVRPIFADIEHYGMLHDSSPIESVMNDRGAVSHDVYAWGVNNINVDLWADGRVFDPGADYYLM